MECLPAYDRIIVERRRIKLHFSFQIGFNIQETQIAHYSETHKRKNLCLSTNRRFFVTAGVTGDFLFNHPKLGRKSLSSYLVNTVPTIQHKVIIRGGCVFSNLRLKKSKTYKNQSKPSPPTNQLNSRLREPQQYMQTVRKAHPYMLDLLVPKPHKCGL